MSFATYAERFAGRDVPRELDFPIEEYRRRIDRVRAEMRRLGLDLLLLGALPDICYLTGHQTPSAGSFACLLLPLEGDPVFQTIDHEYACARYLSWLDRIETFPWYDPERGLRQHEELIAEALQGRRGSRVGVDDKCPVPLPQLEAWAHSRGAQVEWVDAGPLVRQIRRIKSPAEIEAMRQSARITTAAIEEAAASVRPGMRDSDVAAVLMRRMIEEGSEFPSMGPFVATGLRSS